MPASIDDALFQEGRERGFWIKGDGTLIPITHRNSHWDEARKMMVNFNSERKSDWGRDAYDEAFAAGCVRVSHTYYTRTAAVEFDHKASITALQIAATMLRRRDYHRWPVKTEERPVSRRDKADNYVPSTDTDYDTPAKAASALMKAALQRNASALKEMPHAA